MFTQNKFTQFVQIHKTCKRILHLKMEPSSSTIFYEERPVGPQLLYHYSQEGQLIVIHF